MMFATKKDTKINKKKLFYFICYFSTYFLKYYTENSGQFGVLKGPPASLGRRERRQRIIRQEESAESMCE